MSTRTLRSGTTVRTIPSRLPVPTRSVSLPGESPEAVEEDTCLYSEVVSSRPASLRGESTVADPLLGSEVLTKPLPESSDEFSEEEVTSPIYRTRSYIDLDPPKNWGVLMLNCAATRQSSGKRRIPRKYIEFSTNSTLKVPNLNLECLLFPPLLRTQQRLSFYLHARHRTRPKRRSPSFG